MSVTETTQFLRRFLLIEIVFLVLTQSANGVLTQSANGVRAQSSNGVLTQSANGIRAQSSSNDVKLQVIVSTSGCLHAGSENGKIQFCLTKPEPQRVLKLLQSADDESSGKIAKVLMGKSDVAKVMWGCVALKADGNDLQRGSSTLYEVREF